MADARPAQVTSDPGPARDTRQEVRQRPGMTGQAPEASPVVRVRKAQKPREFVPLANPARVNPEPGPQPAPRKKFAARKANEATEKAQEVAEAKAE